MCKCLQNQKECSCTDGQVSVVIDDALFSEKQARPVHNSTKNERPNYAHDCAKALLKSQTQHFLVFTNTIGVQFRNRSGGQKVDDQADGDDDGKVDVVAALIAAWGSDSFAVSVFNTRAIGVEVLIACNQAPFSASSKASIEVLERKLFCINIHKITNKITISFLH